MFAFTPFHLQIAGVVILVAVGLAALWWVARVAMGWHSGRATYLIGERPEDEADDDEDGGDAR